MGAGYDGSIVINSKLDNRDFMSNSKQLLQAIKSLQNTAKSMGANMASSATGYGAAIKKDISSAKELRAEIANLTRVAADMRKELSDSGSRSGAKQFLDLRDKLKRTEKAYDAALQKQQHFEQTKGVNSQAYKNAAAETDRLGDRIDALRQKLDNIKTSNREILSYRDQEQSVREIESNLQGLRRQLQEVNAEAASTRFDDTGMKEAFSSVAASAGRAAANIAKIAGGAVLSFLGKLASSAKNAAIQLAKLASGAIIGGLRKIAGIVKQAAAGLLSLTKRSKDSNNSFKKGFTTILKYGFGIRSLYYLFRKLRAAITDSFSELSKHDPQVKASISSLQTALNGLKGSLATAFAPIFTAIAPALTALINWLTSAMNAIGAFMAALTGGKTYSMAVGGLKATGKAAGGSSKKVKELKRELAGFDELNILSDKNKNSGGGGGGGGGKASGLKYITKNIPQDITDFVDQLKDKWQKGDFKGLGQLIAFKINYALMKARELISWENVEEKVSGGVTAVAEIFNGLTDPKTGIDFETLGSAFSNGVDSLVNTIDLLVRKITAANIGIGIANFLNGIINNKQLFTDIKQGFEDIVGALTDLADAFLTTFQEGSLAKRIRETLGDSAMWKRIAAEIWGVIKHAFSITGSFLDVLLGGDGALDKEVDDSATDINEAINEKLAIRNGKGTTSVWDSIADNLAKGFNIAIEKLTNFISNMPISDVVGGIADWLIRVKNKVRWDYFGDMIGTTAGKAFDFVKTISAKLRENAAVDGANLAAAINHIVRTAFKSGIIADTFTNFVTGAFDFIKAFLTGFNAETAAAKLRKEVLAIPWGDIAREAWDAFKLAVGRLGSFLTVLFGGEVDTGKAENAVDAVERMWDRHDGTKQTIDYSNIGGIYGNLVVTILDAITAAFGEIPWTDWGIRIHKFLVEDIPWTDIFNSILGLFIQALNGIQDLIFAAIFGEDFKNNKLFQLLFPMQSLAYTVKDAMEQPDVQEAIQDSGKKFFEARTPKEGVEYESTGDPVADVLTYFVQGLKEKMPEVAESYSDVGRPASDDLKATAKSLQEMGYSADEIIAAIAKTDEEQQLLRETLALSAQATEDNTSAVEDFDWSEWEAETGDEVRARAEQNKEPDWISEWREETGDEVKERAEQNKETAGLTSALGAIMIESFSGLGEALSGGAHAEEGQGVYSEDFFKNADAQKKQTKETKKLTKTIKNKGEDVVDVNYEGAGFDTSGDRPKLNVGVQFAPEGEEPTDDNTNGGLLGWLQTLLDPGVSIETKVSMIKEGWNSFLSFLGINTNQPLIKTIIELIKKGFTSFLKFLGIDTDNPLIKTAIQLVKQGFVSFLKFIGIDTTNPIIKTLIDLLFGKTDPDAKDALDAGGTTQNATVNTLLKKGDTWFGNGWTLISLAGSVLGAITGSTNLKKGSTWVGAAWTVISGAGSVLSAIIGSTNLKKGTKWFANGWTIISKAGQTLKGIFGSSNLKKGGTWYSNGWTVITKAGETLKGIFSSSNLKKGSTWYSNGWSVITKAGETLKGIFSSSNLKKGSTWYSNGWSVISKAGQTLKGIFSSVNLDKGKTWIEEAWTALTSSDHTTTTTAELKGDIDTNTPEWTSITAKPHKAKTTAELGGKINTKTNAYKTMTATDHGAKTTVKIANGNIKKGSKEYKAMTAKDHTVTTSVKLTFANVANSIKQAIKTLLGLESGGIISRSGKLTRFANGGSIMRNGRTSWWDSVNKYAAGTSRAHGTVFVAGEAGPEIMGHVNGRTEILNKSQLADAIYGAVVSGMAGAVNALGVYLANHMTNCTNSIVQTIGANSVFAGMNYYQPAMANGGIMPYDVAMQIARSTQEIQNTLDANNEDLIQALVSAMGNAANSIITAMQRNQNNVNQRRSYGQSIDDINRSTLMFGKSPLKGV